MSAEAAAALQAACKRGSQLQAYVASTRDVDEELYERMRPQLAHTAGERLAALEAALEAVRAEASPAREAAAEEAARRDEAEAVAQAAAERAAEAAEAAAAADRAAAEAARDAAQRLPASHVAFLVERAVRWSLAVDNAHQALLRAAAEALLLDGAPGPERRATVYGRQLLLQPYTLLAADLCNTPAVRAAATALPRDSAAAAGGGTVMSVLRKHPGLFHMREVRPPGGGPVPGGGGGQSLVRLRAEELPSYGTLVGDLRRVAEVMLSPEAEAGAQAGPPSARQAEEAAVLRAAVCHLAGAHSLAHGGFFIDSLHAVAEALPGALRERYGGGGGPDEPGLYGLLVVLSNHPFVDVPHELTQPVGHGRVRLCTNIVLEYAWKLRKAEADAAAGGA